MAKLPLEGVRILEPAHMLAGPFATTLLADFGAEVIKVERPPTGDLMRQLSPIHNGVSLWFKVTGRNKKSITLDLGLPKGRELFLRLVAKVDVVVENFRPGTMEKWGLGWEDLRRANPRVVLARASGFGQTGPYAGYTSFGNNIESYAGLTGSLGYSDTPPVTSGLADHIPALFTALSVMTALYHRDVHGGPGQWIDSAATEALLRLAESQIPAAGFGLPERQKPPSTRPSSFSFGDFRCQGMFATSDGKWVTFVPAMRPIWDRFMKAIGREDYLEEAAYPLGSEARTRRAEEVHQFVRQWFARHTRDELQKLMAQFEVPMGPVYNMRDVLADRHFQERGVLVDVEDPELGTIKMVGPVPRLSETPGVVRHAGPRLGEHNAEVFGRLLGLSEGDLEALREEGVI